MAGFYSSGYNLPDLTPYLFVVIPKPKFLHYNFSFPHRSNYLCHPVILANQFG